MNKIGKFGVRKRASTMVISLVSVGLMFIGIPLASNASAGAAAKKSPVKIALIEDLTGGDAITGAGGQAGAITAVDQINAKGGIDGHKIVVTTYDAQSNAITAEAVLREAISLHPAAITGHVQSLETVTMAPIIAEAKIPWLTATYPLPQTVLPFYFVSSPNPTQTAEGVVGGLLQELGGSLQGKVIGIEGLNAPAVTANLAAVEALVVADGGKIGPIISDPVVISSWASEAQTMVAANPAAVVTNHTETATATVAEALVTAGFKGPIVSTEGANSDTMMSAINAPNFFAVRESVDPKPGTAMYRAGLKAGDSPANMSNAFYAKDFANMYVIADVLKKCGVNCSTRKFEITLKKLGNITIPLNDLIGPLNFSKTQGGLTKAQLWTWNSAKGTSVSVGSIFSIPWS